jgi:hypothetical protein
MMRKLLFLFAVLAMTSVASAQLITLQISSLNGEPIAPTDYIEVGESDWVNFDIIYVQDGAMNLMSLDAIVSVAGLGSLNGQEIVPAPGGLTWPYNEGFNNTLELEPGVAYEVATGSFMAGMSDGILIDHFLVHCDQGDPENDVIISVGPGFTWGGTIYIDGVTPYDGAWGSVTMRNTPEPMTIALLGLGGLALLRRRK